MSETNYKLAEQQQQQRYDQFAEKLDAADLSADLALARFLTEQAASKSPHLAASLLATVARLANAHFDRQVKTGEMLHRKAMLDTATEIVRIFCRHFGDLPEFNQRIDAVAAEIETTVTSAVNPKRLPPP